MKPNLPYYHILEQIGHGGTGAVYKAIDERSGFLVAVKVLFKRAFENNFIRDKFIEEANRYLYLDHPNIVGLKDFIIGEEGYYLVMEYVEGLSLDKYIRNITGPIPEEVAKAIMVEVLKAMSYAHQEGVIHMDLKPANIMVADNGDIKVLDFGIATEKGESNYKVMGSPLYMSPEQVKGKGIDSTSDIYSLGVTLYQMITAQEPYPSNISKDELFQLILHSPFISNSGMSKDMLSEEFSRIIQKATAKDKRSRYKTCSDFITDLEATY